MKKNLNLSLSKKVRKKLRKSGAKTKMSRTTDKHVNLDKRYQMANNWKADIFVSIHHNSSRLGILKSGGLTIYPATNGNRSKKSATLAAYILFGFFSNLGIGGFYADNRGLAVLNGTNMPATLVEAGYMSNDYDMNIILNAKESIANGIVRGIKGYFKKY